MLALCEVYIKLTEVILLGENRNQITDPPSPIYVQLATTLYMQTLDKTTDLVLSGTDLFSKLV